MMQPDKSTFSFRQNSLRFRKPDSGPLAISIVLGNRVLLAGIAACFSIVWGRTAYGNIAYVFSLGSLGSVLFNCGLDQMIIKAKPDDILAVYKQAGIFTTVSTAVLTIFTAIVFSSLLPAVLLAGALALFGQVSAGRQVSHMYILGLAVKLLVPYSCWAMAIVVIRPFYDSGAVGCAGLVTLLFAGFAYLRYFSQLKKDFPSSHTRVAMRPTILSGIQIMLFSSALAVLQQTDVIMLHAYASAATVGAYALAVRLAGLALIGHVASSAVMPRQMAEAFSHKSDLGVLRLALQGWLKINVLVFLVVSTGLSILVAMGFVVDKVVLLVLLVGIFVNIATGLCGFALNMAGFAKWSFAAGFLALLINILLNLWLIPSLGALGAAISTSVSVMAMNTLLAILASRLTGLNTTLLPRRGSHTLFYSDN